MAVGYSHWAKRDFRFKEMEIETLKAMKHFRWQILPGECNEGWPDHLPFVMEYNSDGSDCSNFIESTATLHKNHVRNIKVLKLKASALRTRAAQVPKES